MVNLNSFIFSNSRNYRIARHSFFWIAWILYYSFITTYYWSSMHPFSISFAAAITEVTLTTPLDMAFCYLIIYFLIPNFLYKGHYISMIIWWLGLSIVFILLFNLFTLNITTHIRSFFGMPLPPVSRPFIWIFFDLFSQINMEGCLAASIKLGKLWHIKQQEVELLKKEKMQIEPSHINNEFSPLFMAEMLVRTENMIKEKPLLAANMLGKIRNMLLYILYDNNRPLVLLEKELDVLKDYVEMERMSATLNMDIQLNISGKINLEKIAPFIILPLLENAFRQVSLLKMDEKNLHINIQVDNGFFTMRLSWNKPGDTAAMMTRKGVFLQDITNRLRLIYPNSYKLKTIIEVEKANIFFEVNLRKAVNI